MEEPSKGCFYNIVSSGEEVLILSLVHEPGHTGGITFGAYASLTKRKLNDLRMDVVEGGSGWAEIKLARNKKVIAYFMPDHMTFDQMVREGREKMKNRHVAVE